jgi:hypothetical protein
MRTFHAAIVKTKKLMMTRLSMRSIADLISKHTDPVVVDCFDAVWRLAAVA